MVSSDLGRPGTTLAWPSPAQRDPDPSLQAPWAPRCRSMRLPPRVWDCCAVAAMADETHLVSPRPPTHPGRLAPHLMASIPGLPASPGGRGGGRQGVGCLSKTTCDRRQCDILLRVISQDAVLASAHPHAL